MALVLQIENLHYRFVQQDTVIHAVNGISLKIQQSECLGLMGESGSGKSVTAMAVTGLNSSPPGQQTGGIITFKDTDLTTPGDMQKVRSRGIAYVFQNPVESLSPYQTIEHQLFSLIRLHSADKKNRRDLNTESVDYLSQAGIQNGSSLLNQYPSELSGGMCQRVAIAMALICAPDLMILDEPTTNLDVSTQGKILELLVNLKKERKMSFLYISHNAGVIKKICDHVAVMYKGVIVEKLPVSVLTAKPLHPYTRGLIRSIPPLNYSAERIDGIPGQPPDPRIQTDGCSFFNRCDIGTELCRTSEPGLRKIGKDHYVACHLSSGKAPGEAADE